jgi:hypothetical protein
LIRRWWFIMIEYLPTIVAVAAIIATSFLTLRMMERRSATRDEERLNIKDVALKEDFRRVDERYDEQVLRCRKEFVLQRELKPTLESIDRRLANIETNTTSK